MNRKRWIIIGGTLVIAAIAAYVFRGVIERTIILPLLYLWWLLGLFYRTLPQFILWFILVIVVFFSAITTLMPEPEFRRARRDKRKLTAGQVEDLAVWINKTKHGNYYKWLIANRLGKLARELLAQRDGRPVSKTFGRLNGRDWNPPKDVDAYLESGLNGSFADYPQPRWMRPQPTPLDIPVKDVVEYLETEMETNHNGHR